MQHMSKAFWATASVTLMGMLMACSGLAGIEEPDVLGAIQARDDAALESLLRSGADPNQRFDGESALTWSVWRGTARSVEILLKSGAEVQQDSSDGWGWDSIVEAVQEDSVTRSEALAKARLLVDAGYSPCASVEIGEPPSDRLGEYASTDTDRQMLKDLVEMEQACG